MEKPKYKIPLLSEIQSGMSCGLKVVSTFSGAGGSCTGYEMAGYDVVWANEFSPVAAASYRANHPNSILDERSIKEITGKEILDVLKLSKGEIDLLDGSPPCQAFSTAGKGKKGWGVERKYAHGATQCNETLFFDYIRLLNDLQPKVFVAENVKGLLSESNVELLGENQAQLFDSQENTILHGLMNAGYKMQWSVLNACDYGVPQRRKRLFFIGIRNDLVDLIKCCNFFPKKSEIKYTVSESWHDVVGIKRATFRRGGFGVDEILNGPCSTITATQSGIQIYFQESERKCTIDELKRIGAFPDDYNFVGAYFQQWMQIGNSVPPLMMKAIAENLRDNVFTQIKPIQFTKRIVKNKTFSKAESATSAQAQLATEVEKTEKRKKTEPVVKGALDSKWDDYWAKRGFARCAEADQQPGQKPTT